MTSEPPVDSSGYRRHMVIGTLWTVGMRWAMRGIGLISTLILARLLAPEDFGMVAMVMVLLAFIGVFLDFGVEMVLIRMSQPSRAHYDAAFTLQLIQAVVTALLLVLVAPLAAWYYDEPAVQTLMWVLTLYVLLSGLENVGIIDFRRHLQFERDFRFMVMVKLIAFVCTISAAFALRSYWALVLGMTISRLAATVLSYYVHPFRPRLNLSHIPELWRFSKWLIAGNVGRFFEYKGDILIAGGVSDARGTGMYSLGHELATLPAHELSEPIGRALYPVMSRINNDIARVRGAYLQTVGATATLILPLCIGMALVAEDAVPVLLGPGWSEVIPLLQILALYAALRTLLTHVSDTLNVLGLPRTAALFWLGQGGLTMLACVIGGIIWGLPGIAWGNVVATACMVVPLLILLRVTLQLGVARFIQAIWRPWFAAGVMALGLWLFPGIDTQWVLLSLTQDVVLGAGIYVLALFLGWLASGRPNGIETLGLQYLGRSFRIVK
ncbi:lipopolysaccharide biosynthesis protein [Ectothiorhodospira marina]|uniref:Membrane protein involved in the export of O-antigen and teichoic acid n=1 Tax=Ectothiorhodospira marina TaxID=1396821 RepID=A0A1H7IDW3_9GAMM|nr:lipopolysaccharide biosynthesis protein [Ectothiorhodospira marina]SEK60032.1 Membrane protein involved in the export of O-antigen and teichoic acid [Ectothiorhodospira marina]